MRANQAVLVCVVLEDEDRYTHLLENEQDVHYAEE